MAGQPAQIANSDALGDGKSFIGRPSDLSEEVHRPSKRANSTDDFSDRDFDRRRSRDRDQLEKDRHWTADERGRGKERHREGERDHGRSREKERSREGQKDQDRNREKERHRKIGRDQSWKMEMDSNKERVRESDRDKGRSRERERSKERYRERDKERDRYRHWDKNRDQERGREKIRERDREREHRRSGYSKNIYEKRHDEERDGHREKSRERERKEQEKELKGRERDCSSSIWSRRPRNTDYKPSDHLANQDKDQRTIFAYQINLMANERDVYEFFSRAGKVRDVHLISEHNNWRPGRVGYVEFANVMSIPIAIALSGEFLAGEPVLVKTLEAEKNDVQSTTTTTSGMMGPFSEGSKTLYVDNLHPGITEEQIRQVFESFGTVELVQMPREPDSMQCKGFGFVQFTNLEDARSALHLNGQLEIAGRVIKVSSASDDQVGTQESVKKDVDLDNDDSGLALNSQARALLMQKLARSIASSTSGTLPLNLLPASQLDTIGVPSECLLMKNMFDPGSKCRQHLILTWTSRRTLRMSALNLAW
ncbi:uncharacterized protein LOC144714863 isoform X2 [Wolffia australiana]